MRLLLTAVDFTSDGYQCTRFVCHGQASTNLVIPDSLGESEKEKTSHRDARIKRGET